MFTRPSLFGLCTAICCVSTLVIATTMKSLPADLVASVVVIVMLATTLREYRKSH